MFIDVQGYIQYWYIQYHRIQGSFSPIPDSPCSHGDVDVFCDPEHGHWLQMCCTCSLAKPVEAGELLQRSSYATQRYLLLPFANIRLAFGPIKIVIKNRGDTEIGAAGMLKCPVLPCIRPVGLPLAELCSNWIHRCKVEHLEGFKSKVELRGK